jgi:hypothetical protein
MGVEQSNFSSSKLKNFGYRIYKLKKDGILFNLGLKELEDFIIPPENLIDKNISFIDWLKLNKENKIILKIFSILKRNFRTIEINNNNNNDKILGATIRFENYINAIKKCLHVIKIKENSFSQLKLKLEENNDFLIAIQPKGKEIQSLNVSNKNPLNYFSQLIKENKGNECDFFIYNINKGAKIINATIENNNNFSLGCDVAFGALHYFPNKSEMNLNDELKGLKDDDEKEEIEMNINYNV